MYPLFWALLKYCFWRLTDELKKIHDNQPDKFEFTKTNLELAEKIIKKISVRSRKSAVMPLLYLAQNQNENWIPLAAMKYIGKYLSMPCINVYEIATFSPACII